eukprot:CAMPEP_0119059734 /NCGR_PEP_ID=MMETSP1178-20130426/3801_1 /TAXON_ID=33656 /ORGANISM="unid sp, Strain CCMP2000" /LENGTH=97 /DNA_ID=CAMNT_0007040787 /DNA_START=124 /DNA_END=418 /DNA_ORIENTATION=-
MTRALIGMSAWSTAGPQIYPQKFAKGGSRVQSSPQGPTQPHLTLALALSNAGEHLEPNRTSITGIPKPQPSRLHRGCQLMFMSCRSPMSAVSKRVEE